MLKRELLFALAKEKAIKENKSVCIFAGDKKILIEPIRRNETMKKIFDMTKEDFAAVPYLDTWNNWDELVKDNPSGRLEFSSVVIVPAMHDGEIAIHESEWACMDFVLCKDSVPIGKVGGCSDVLHLDGIGGYGEDHRAGLISRMVPVKGWSIDCLPKTGYLNLWTRNVLYLRDKFVGSSAEIYSSTEMWKHGEKKEEGE